jgi:hypothetical protein
MDQVFEGTPRVQVRLEGRKASYGEIENDWGSRMQWRVTRNGVVIATPSARAAESYEHPTEEPGRYVLSLEMWKYEGFRNGTLGQYVSVSNEVGYTI